MKKLISLFTALFLLMSALPAQAESPEISDLLTEYYKEWQELPFGLTEDELTCVDGVLYGRDILLLYPKTRTDACFVIPDGIGYVWDFAFVGNDFHRRSSVFLYAAASIRFPGEDCVHW